MPRFVFAFLLCATLAPAGRSQDLVRTPRITPDAPSAAYVNARWYHADADGVRFELGERYSIAGVFTATRPAQVDTVIDLGGAFVVPPFGEAHNHNVDGPWTMGTANEYLTQGIFYHKNPNSVGATSRAGRDQFNQPTTLDLVHAYGGLSTDEGHPEQLYRRLAASYRVDPDSLDGVVFFDLPDVATAEARWGEVMRGGPDFLKLYLLNAEQQGDSVSKGLAPDVFRRVVDLANEAGLETTVHIETARDLALAVDAGASEVAHLPGYFWSNGLDADGYRISDALAQRIADTGFRIVTTTIVTTAILAADSMRRQAVQALQVENLRRLHAAGARIVIGADSYLQTSRDEAMHLRGLGAFDDETLLRLWIDTAAASIFPRRAIGRLAPSYEASFVALDCDPVVDFACVEQITARVKQGMPLD